ncbi:MAG: ribosome biogenesis GTPase Der [bacterium]
MINKNLKTVALIGRPNVGKSTLFNRLVGKRVAIETPVAGTTRDRLYETVSWGNHQFYIMDVAGVETGKLDELDSDMQRGVDFAIDNSDLILFVVDWNDQSNQSDINIARKLRKLEKNVLLIVNKADNLKRSDEIDVFKRLGGFKVLPVSAISGMSTGDLMDEICANLKLTDEDRVEEERNEGEIRLAIIGRPNVGKSTLLNTIIGEKRAVVSSVAGTTRDTLDVSFFHKGKKIIMTDTAGVRRHGKIVRDTPESFGLVRTYKALRECDVAILIIDAEEGLVATDTHILGSAKDWGKGVVLVINKIDAIEGDREAFMDHMLYKLQIELNFAPWLPVVFISAKDDENIKPMLDRVISADESRKTLIPEEDMKEIVAFIRNSNNQLQNLKYIRQKAINPPTFDFKFTNKRIAHKSQFRYIENKIRDAYPMAGTPIYLDLVT